MNRNLILLSLAVLFIKCTLETNQKTEIDQVINTVSGDSISAHIAYLASDYLKGRLPGTPEFGLALDYVVQKYKEFGMEPAGEDGTFYQMLTVRNSKINVNGSDLNWDSEILKSNTDYYFLGNLNQTKTETEGEIIFGGYGVEAPELNYNDFSNLDCQGKILLLLTGAPVNFQSAELAHFANWETKFQAAARNGATGVIVINPNAPEENNFERTAMRVNKRGNFGVLGMDSIPFGRRVFPEQLGFVAFVNYHSIRNFNLEKVINKYSQNHFVGESFGNVKARTTSLFSEFMSANAIAKIPGGKLKNEYVVQTAHLDHVGIGEPVNGDSIYNGAHDNASGVASLLEIARLYTRLDKKPERSILFVVVTAEEMGLLGSDYFSHYPTVPIESIVANVNTDMPTLIAPLLSIEPLGAEHSSLMDQVKEAAQHLGLEIMPDHMPEQVRFVRSDQYNFIKRGIPALHIKYGLKTSDPEIDLSQVIKDFTNNVYHKPSDELNGLFDFEAGKVYVKLNFLVSYYISSNPNRPSWNDGDFFKRFMKQ